MDAVQFFLPSITLCKSRDIRSLMGETATDRHGILKQDTEATDPLFPHNYFKLTPFSLNLFHW